MSRRAGMSFTPHLELRKQLVTAIQMWLRSNGSRPEEIAQRLDVEPTIIHEIAQGKTSLRLEMLLTFWERLGGHYRLQLEHPTIDPTPREPKAPPIRGPWARGARVRRGHEGG